jgi:hypothetical protein
MRRKITPVYHALILYQYQLMGAGGGGAGVGVLLCTVTTVCLTVELLVCVRGILYVCCRVCQGGDMYASICQSMS